MKIKEVNMLEGSVMKGLFAMSLPIILMNVFQQIFNAIDMTVLGKFASDAAVGSVGACGTPITLFTGLVGGLAAGANVVISRFLGHGDKERAERTVGTSILVGLIGGFLLLGALGNKERSAYGRIDFSCREALKKGVELKRVAVLDSCPIKAVMGFLSRGSYLVLEVYDESERHLFDLPQNELAVWFLHAKTPYESLKNIKNVIK